MLARNLTELRTPALVIDRRILDRNLARMRAHVRDLGCVLRPHVKTSKSIDILRRAVPDTPGGITVSSLREAEYFFEHGIADIVYAVALAPAKIARAIELAAGGLQLAVLTDSPETVRLLSAAAGGAGVTLSVLLEIDVDGHRAGLAPDSDLLGDLARAIASSPGLRFAGVLAHAGGSYDSRSVAAIREAAARERTETVRAAERLRRGGVDVPLVSIGSTPTVTCAEDLTGITEVRAGVYMFQDLVMAGLGVCGQDDIALSVLVSVIGHKPEKGWIITDGGWMALSRDRGTAAQEIDQGYGVVRDVLCGALDDDLIVAATNQEHGIVCRRDRGLAAASYPVGTLLRVLPNHACATAAQHERYFVVEDGDEIVDSWERINGW